MNSRILSGYVEHARLVPVTHRFRHRVHFVAIDLDELESLDRTVRGFGYNRPAAVSLRDRDYLAPGPGRLRDKLTPWIESLALPTVPARVTLVTSPRWLGAVFNPVSFYLLDDAAGEPLGLIAEVNNTFGDRHVYPVLLEAMPGPAPATGEAPKIFHVSPFNNLEGRYRFTLRRSSDELYIGVDLYRDGQRIIETWIEGSGPEWSTRALWSQYLLHPLRPWLTFPRILWQAMFLKFQHRLPHFRRPEPSHPNTILSRGARRPA